MGKTEDTYLEKKIAGAFTKLELSSKIYFFFTQFLKVKKFNITVLKES